MNYKFKFKTKLIKKSCKEKLNSNFSKALLWLYKTYLYKRLKIGQSILDAEEVFTRKNEKTVVDFSGLEVDSITFSDLIKIEDVSEFSKELISVLTPLKPDFLQTESVKKSVYSSLRDFEDSYKTIKYGRIFRGINQNKKIDLIDRISIYYIKGEDSFFIVKYYVDPSVKFNQLLQELLKKPNNNTIELQNLKLSCLWTDKNLKLSYKFLHQTTRDYLQMLFNEINFQLKELLLKNLSFGQFKTDTKLLFPSIVTFKYDRTNFENYERILFRSLDTNFYRIYKKDDLYLARGSSNLKNNPSNTVYMLFKKRNEQELDNGRNSIGNLSNDYADLILPLWILLNVAIREQSKYILFRKEIFQILKQKSNSLFLRRFLKIKQEITLQIIDYKRLKNDFFSERLSERGETKQLEIFTRICETPNCKKNHNFQFELVEETTSSFENLNSSFNDLLNLLHEVSDIQSIRANMRLQKILLILTIIGTILAVYSANSSYINNWIENLLNYFGVTIPKPK